MIGLLVLLLVLAGLISIGIYWISWENEDSRTRTPFFMKVASDCRALIPAGFGSPENRESRITVLSPGSREPSSDRG
jgi:hypothetical protein